MNIPYPVYLDKVYGCFLGKTVFGTLGAPYEGIKMPMNLQFRRDMIDTMLPNDDLDLQILWLEVFEKYGPAFTSRQLLEGFVTQCDYSPGEYAIMRKNFVKGIYPPVSGSFCNDFYKAGMGCPIRSEIWACLAPGNPQLAKEYSLRDGTMDHEGDSVQGEVFFAALEALAFVKSDLNDLVEAALAYVDSLPFREFLQYCVKIAKEEADTKKVFNKLLKRYGHPDCTNLYQNIGIVMLGLYHGNLDAIKSSMLALNLGFDTDCTCATIGAILGTMEGAARLQEKYQVGDTRYVLSVRANRRSDSVRDLAEDIARLGVHGVEMGVNTAVKLTNSPAVSFNFLPSAPVRISATYEGNLPSIAFGESRILTLHLLNTSADTMELECRCTPPRGVRLVCRDAMTFRLGAAQEKALSFQVTVAIDEPVLFERNLIRFSLWSQGREVASEIIGISGAAAYKLSGPFWKTEMAFTDEQLTGAKSYYSLFADKGSAGANADAVRDFHLGFHHDRTAFVGEEELFAPAVPEKENDRYETDVVSLPQDSFALDDLYQMKGATVCYLSRVLLVPEDADLPQYASSSKEVFPLAPGRDVCMQIGYTDPFQVWLNGELIAQRDTFESFTGENVHLAGLKLRKGENRLILRLTKLTPSAKFSLVFSTGPTCAEHYVCFGSKNPALF